MSAYRLSPPTPGDESLLSKPRLITSLLPLLSTETPLDPTPRKFGPGSATGPAFVTPAPQDFGTSESGVDTPPAKNCPFLWEVAIGMLFASCCCCCCRADAIREWDLRLLHVKRKSCAARLPSLRGFFEFVVQGLASSRIIISWKVPYTSGLGSASQRMGLSLTSC